MVTPNPPVEIYMSPGVPAKQAYQTLLHHYSVSDRALTRAEEKLQELQSLRTVEHVTPEVIKKAMLQLFQNVQLTDQSSKNSPSTQVPAGPQASGSSSGEESPKTGNDEEYLQGFPSVPKRKITPDQSAIPEDRISAMKEPMHLWRI